MNELTTSEIGKFPPTWRVVRFDAAFEIQQGKQVSKSNRVGNNPRPFLRTRNVFWGKLDLADLDQMNFSPAEEARLQLAMDDLLICEGGDIGRTGIWRGELEHCYYQNHLHRARLRDKEKVSARYSLYWLWYAFNIGKLYFGRGNVTTIPNLSQSKLGELPLALPPIGQQKAIAHILGLVHRSIEEQETLLGLTAELKRTLLQQLFTAGLRHEQQKQTDVGLIPGSWNVVDLGDLISQSPKNGLYKHNKFYGAGTNILRINDFSNDGDIVVKASNRLTTDPNETLLYGLTEGDIVTNRVNSLSHLGKTALIGKITEPMVFESNMMRYRVDETRVDLRYILRLINSPICKKQFLGSAKRAVGQASINQGDLRAIKIPLPPLDEQIEIAQIFDAVLKSLERHQKKHSSLNDLFRSLLHQLMTGEILVDNLDLRQLKNSLAA